MRKLAGFFLACTVIYVYLKYVLVAYLKAIIYPSSEALKTYGSPESAAKFYLAGLIFWAVIYGIVAYGLLKFGGVI
jgi:hypothetical protein